MSNKKTILKTLALFTILVLCSSCASNKAKALKCPSHSSVIEQPTFKQA